MKLIILQFQIDGRPKAMEPETTFKVYCPGQYKRFPYKLMMYNDGSVTNNVRYKNLCVERFAVSVAHNNEPTVFEVVNGTLVDMREKMGHLHGNLVGAYDYISEDDEVLSMFLIKNYNIIINWIDANYTWGWLDDETGMWTGAVGKVNIDLLSKVYLMYILRRRLDFFRYCNL